MTNVENCEMMILNDANNDDDEEVDDKKSYSVIFAAGPLSQF